MDGGGPKHKLCALWGARSRENAIINQALSPEQTRFWSGVSGYRPSSAPPRFCRFVWGSFFGSFSVVALGKTGGSLGLSFLKLPMGCCLNEEKKAASCLLRHGFIFTGVSDLIVSRRHPPPDSAVTARIYISSATTARTSLHHTAKHLHHRSSTSTNTAARCLRC